MSAVRPLAESVKAPGSAAGGFATTRWSMVLHAADEDGEAGRAALEELCRMYWPALYAFARRRGSPPQDAEDLTQGFFCDMLARGAIAHADAHRGRFRTFLLTSFLNYSSHQRARAGSSKRGGKCEIISFEALVDAEGHFLNEPATAETPERYFDRQWARQLLERALAAVRYDYVASGRGALYDGLSGALLGERGDVPYETMAAKLGLSAGALKVAMHRLRHRFGDQLRCEVAKTVLKTEEIEPEIRYLLAAFGV